MKSDLAARRARIRRLAAKRPAIDLEVDHAPRSEARERLVDLLVELLDPGARSGGPSSSR